MFKVKDKVQVKLQEVFIGTVLEVGESDVLVEHNTIINGRTKIIKQWYDNDVVTAIKKTTPKKEIQSTETESGNIELGVPIENIEGMEE